MGRRGHVMKALYRGILGGVIVVLLGAGLAAALLVDPSDEKATGRSPATTTPAGAPSESPDATVAPTEPPTTVASASRADASRSLCRDIDAAIQSVVGGRVVAGGLRLSGAVNRYAETADPAIVAPARRILATALQGDLDASIAAADEANTACTRLGSPISSFPGGGGDGGGGGYVPCDFPPC